jgi:hypothetical protein
MANYSEYDGPVPSHGSTLQSPHVPSFEITADQSDPGSSPCSKRPQSCARTLAASRCTRRPRRGPGARSSNRSRDRQQYPPLELARCSIAITRNIWATPMHFPIRVHRFWCIKGFGRGKGRWRTEDQQAAKHKCLVSGRFPSLTRVTGHAYAADEGLLSADAPEPGGLARTGS